jgi:DNA-binding MarR family transcriptional regulator
MEINSFLDIMRDGLSVSNEELISHLYNSMVKFAINGYENDGLNNLEKTYRYIVKYKPENFLKDPKRSKREIYYYIGVIATCYELFKAIKDENELDKSNFEIILKYKHASSFICFLYKNSNVTHAQICKYMKISPSTLTKFLSEFQQYDYFVSRRIKQHKIYNINFNGRRLYSSIMKMREMAEIYIRMQ